MLQMIILMIRPPSCSSVTLQKIVCKEDGSPHDQNQGVRGAGIVANDHPDDPAYSVPLQKVVCKEDCPLGRGVRSDAQLSCTETRFQKSALRVVEILLNNVINIYG